MNAYFVFGLVGAFLVLCSGICIGIQARNSDGNEGQIPLETLDRWRARTEWREKRPKE